MQHGPSSLTITLPSKWVKKQGIRKGEEIEVEQYGIGLLIYAKKRTKTPIITIKKIVEDIKHDEDFIKSVVKKVQKELAKK